MGSKIQMQDWPYLKKYQKENSKLPDLTSGQKRIVFMGDSITEFWSALCPEFFIGKLNNDFPFFFKHQTVQLKRFAGKCIGIFVVIKCNELI